MIPRFVIPAVVVAGAASLALAQQPLEQPPNTWVKRSPLKTAPISPGMGYEAALAYDPVALAEE